MTRPSTQGFILVALTIGSLILASCQTTPTGPAISKTPVQGAPYGSLKIAVDFAQGILDPKYDSGYNFYTLGGALLDSLMRQAPDAPEALPGLAERFEISPDGRRHTFYLRKGVKFHDGSDLTAEDVKYSIERYLVTESRQPSKAGWLTVVDKVETKDDHTFIMYMKSPQFELLDSLETGMGAVTPKKYIEEKGEEYFGRNPVGSGPWRFVSYQQGNRLELEANENYWDRARVPKFKNLSLLNVPEEATRIAMLKTGELDLAQISIDSVSAVKAAGLGIKSWDSGSRFFGYHFYDLDHPEKYALSDRRVREAMLLAVNRQEIIDKLFSGFGSPTVMYPISPKADIFDPNVLKLDPYDPDKAKTLMTQAGYPNGFDTRILNTAAAGTTLAMFNQALAGYWQKVGVKTALESIDRATVLSMFMPKHKPEIWNSTWTALSGTARGFGTVVKGFHSQGSAKNIKNPELDALMDKAPTVADAAERKRVMVQALATAKSEYSAPAYVNVNTVWASGPKVGDMSTTFANIITGLYETITHGK